jgi:hypothetical protein
MSRTARLQAVIASTGAALCLAAAPPLAAQDFTVHGYVELRAAWAGDETSWMDGGLGKTRFGEGDAFATANAALALRWQLTPALSGVAEVQAVPQQRSSLDVLEAYLAYRPVSTTPWRWSTRVGAFFPPISQENGGIGWTSPWTLSPSAIDSWVGEELRTIGIETRVQHRGEATDVEAFAAVFGGNDPAGELIASRGWALGDLTSGLGARLREPDVYAPLAEAPVPVLYRPFVEIDGRPGWYAGVDVDSKAYGKLSLLRYDNRADPEKYADYAGREVYAWHTRFWSLGGQTRLGDVAIVAQAMHGSTSFEPAPDFLLETRFRSGYLLAAWEGAAWTPAIRLDWFDLRQLPDTLAAPLSERGHALTLALNWRPTDKLRVTGEWLWVDSRRAQRALEGLSAQALDQQLQLNLRLLF